MTASGWSGPLPPHARARPCQRAMVGARMRELYDKRDFAVRRLTFEAKERFGGLYAARLDARLNHPTRVLLSTPQAIRLALAGGCESRGLRLANCCTGSSTARRSARTPTRKTRTPA